MKEQTLRRLCNICSQLEQIAADIRAETDEVVATKDHIEVIKHYSLVRTATEITKNSREAIKGIEDNLSRVYIPDIVADLKQRTGQKPPFVIEGVGRATVSYRYSCTMLDRERGIDWLKTNGYPELVQETVNAQTLAAFSKSLLEDEGKELPDDIFKVGTTPYTSITKIR